MANDSVFAVLSTIDCKGHIEKKNNLSYLSWAWAWQILKEKYPSATYTIYENKDGLNYHTDGHTCWVKTGVTVDGIEHIEYLPIMDFRNASIPVGKVTSFDVNKAIQRSLTKAVARHGLGLYIYAGEDIPDPYDDELRAMVNTAVPAPAKPTMSPAHTNWINVLQSIVDGIATLEQYKKKYHFSEYDEQLAKDWILNHQK